MTDKDDLFQGEVPSYRQGAAGALLGERLGCCLS